MNDNPIADDNPGIPRNAVSVYTQDSGMDDFPVLRAFQQYIDAEQSKARKRLVTMGIFFTLLIGAVIAVFVVMLATLSQRNQLLNDRLVEFAMSDRNRQQSAPVVVQSTPQPSDNGALQVLAAKLEEMQKNLAERDKKAEEAAKAAAAAEAAKPKGPTPEQVEIARLKALLDAEKQKSAAEKERRRQEDLDAYRRKHYPELYQTVPKKSDSQSEGKAAQPRKSNTIDEIDEVLDLLDEDDAIDYFKEDDDSPSKPNSRSKPVAKRKPQQQQTPAETTEPKEEAETKEEAPPASEPYKIPVEKTGSSWRIPTE